MREFLGAILAGDRAKATLEARRVFERDGAPSLYDDLMRPALEQVGRLWGEDRITIADEHLATATVECAIAALYPDYPWPLGGPKAVIACAEGERHAMGARMVADLLALDGWDVMFLGGDTPTQALATKVAQTRPALVGLSITLSVNLPAAAAAIGAIRAIAPSSRVLVGGRATHALPDVGAALGAHGFAASGREAIDVARAFRR